MNAEKSTNQPDTCCGHVNRRMFLKMGGGAALAACARGPFGLMAGPFAAAEGNEHLVPADKRLDPAWVRRLIERGKKEVFTGSNLDLIGMPCGGIGSGQLYLSGDGRLGSWQIFNNAASNWVEGTGSTYQHPQFDKPDHLTFVVEAGGREWALNSDAFTCAFKGEYPIGTVTYKKEGAPIEVELEAFSPFIPLEAEDSGLPATIFNVTVKNVGGDPLPVRVLGRLRNVVMTLTGQHFTGERSTAMRFFEGNEDFKHGRALAVHGARPVPGEEDSDAEVFANFEQEGYGDWTATGEAFGAGPAEGTLPGQTAVAGFEGERLVNTFLEGDGPTGTLTSPPFTIRRDFVNFLIGGGAIPSQTCMNLVVDGAVVRTATGANSEVLQWRNWYVGDLKGSEARLVIVDQASGPWGHINVDQIEFSDKKRTPGVAGSLDRAQDYGSVALGVGGPLRTPAALRYADPDKRPRDLGRDEVAYGLTEDAVVELGPEAELGPGERVTATFVLAWHFPNAPEGHFYAARYEDAGDVARYVMDHYGRLAEGTRSWRDAYYDSSLPYWLLDRLHSTLSYLATGTCQWWKNGRFWAYEGVTCCHGTCTHVWNYAHGHARLFPELGRTIRAMQDFNPRERGGGFHSDTGLVGFRSDDNYAADGQCGTILKAYREHAMAPDDGFLRELWPRIKKALQFSIEQDENGDGLIENLQHNTYDINYFGANTFVGSLYLAALRAGEEMAREVGDEAFAEHARAIYQRGRERSVKRLWNGEYFIQDVDLDEHPTMQYGDGCLSDQLFGQGWAHQLGLGYIYPAEMVKTALGSVWKYNWAPDVAPYNEEHPPMRWFISPGMAGLFTCTWPKSAYLEQGTYYKSEVWTGIEYQVAGHMIWEGMVTEGLAICRAIHDRYHPSRFNPYNEVECGDHYARALASWGVYLALAGFRYHGPKARLGFAPRITPGDFKATVTFAEGWGRLSQQRAGSEQRNKVDVLRGSLRLREFSIALPEGAAPKRVAVYAGGARPRVETAQDAEQLTLAFSEDVRLEAGQNLDVKVSLA